MYHMTFWPTYVPGVKLFKLLNDIGEKIPPKPYGNICMEEHQMILKKHKLNIYEQNIGGKQIHPSQVNFI